MELSCPSCGAKHRTEDHPGAFEILCVCGYSLLVPDEKSFAPVEPDPPPRTPTAMDAEDAALAVSPPPAEEVPSPLEMTPPDQLPEGMVYDPFELQQQQVAAPSTDALPQAFELPADAFNPDPAAGASPSGFESIQPSEASPQATEAPKTAPAATPPPGQSLVERVQLASMGHLLGHSFDISCEGLNRENLVLLAKRCSELTKRRPWLETELKKRNIELENLPENPSLKGVPEPVALEIYLTCFELGGTCSIRRSE